MGFDVVYLPPIHPIGTTSRKGADNTLEARPGDPGSPWAIGGPEGGHTAVAPELGTVADLQKLMARAGELGIEIALDYALQCSPDHPWVSEHPEWFHHRPDGSIAYAENPPKKYQDIYPINFWPSSEADRWALWEACRGIVEHWIEVGIRIFRVDNPHTKPMALWEWLIPTVKSGHPDVIFLAEAFTRPKVMAKLAEVGFSQSYTYFTWRNEAWEITEYLQELTAGPVADYMRPSFWPNTPDILAGPLRRGPPSAFKLRLVLAATMVPSYGIYSGYELFESEPASDANEEYSHSEKYEIKQRDWSRPDSLAPWIGLVNSIRRRHPAFWRLRNLTFHHSSNTRILAYSKHTEDRSDVVLTVVNLDPLATHEATLGLDMGALGLAQDALFEVVDELTGKVFGWSGPNPYVRLDPSQEPAHVLHLRGRP
jgi:starch synthase (maltosyl-transferring)